MFASFINFATRFASAPIISLGFFLFALHRLDP
jgi:hypothetical protein